MASSEDLEQMQRMLALEGDLHCALDAAKQRHEDMMHRLDESRRVIERLLRNEAEETTLYVEDTQLQMRAIRDLLHLEMENARRQVDQSISEASANITRARGERERTRQEVQTMRSEVAKRHSKREIERKHELEQARANASARREAERLLQENRLENADAMHVGGGGIDSTGDSARSFAWFWPLVLSVLMCWCIWLAYTKYRAAKRANARRQRVLYSEQLQSHFANIDRGALTETNSVPATPEESPTPSPKGSSHNSTIFTESPARPVADRRPVLRRRLLPQWSPSASAASTTSTISSTDAVAGAPLATPR